MENYFDFYDWLEAQLQHTHTTWFIRCCDPNNLEQEEPWVELQLLIGDDYIHEVYYEFKMTWYERMVELQPLINRAQAQQPTVYVNNAAIIHKAIITMIEHGIPVDNDLVQLQRNI